MWYRASGLAQFKPGGDRQDDRRLRRWLIAKPGGITGSALFIAGSAVAHAQAQGASVPAEHRFWGIVLSGGWTGLAMFGLLLTLSVTAAYLVFDNVMTLRRQVLMPAGLAKRVRQHLEAQQSAAALEACRAQPSPLAFVLLHGLQERMWGWQATEKALEDALAEQSARLLRRVEYLSVIGNLAPMVGLLGTVTGMIFAFQGVADTQGAASAAELAEGIYQALVTTVGGLLIAIPSLGAFAILRNRVDQIIAEMAYSIQHTLSPLKRAQLGGPPAELPPASRRDLAGGTMQG